MRPRPKPLCPASSPPSGSSAPLGSTYATDGSSLPWPSLSTNQMPGARLPSFIKRIDGPLAVIELEMSIMIGSPPVGMPMAIGFGVMIGVMPPCGATLAVHGSALCTITMKPSRAGASR